MSFSPSVLYVFHGVLPYLVVSWMFYSIFCIIIIIITIIIIINYFYYSNVLYVICDMLYVICDMLYVICDM